MPHSVIIELADDLAELGILDIISIRYLVPMSGEIVTIDVNPTFRVVDLSDPDVLDTLYQVNNESDNDSGITDAVSERNRENTEFIILNEVRLLLIITY